MTERRSDTIDVRDMFQQPVESTRLPRFARHPLMRVVLAILFLMPVIQLNNAFSFLVLDRLEDPLLSLVQFPKAILLIILLILTYRFYTRRIERREAHELSGKGGMREFAVGSMLGGGMVLAVVGTLALLGCYRVESLNEPFILIGRLFRYGQGSFIEELVFTVVLFRLLEEFAGTRASLVIVSLLFGVMHLGNDNASLDMALFIGLEEIALLAPFILTRRLWMSWAVHFSWNYTQTAIFGLNNSGMEQGGFLQPTLVGLPALTGGEFGIEGSVLSLAANLCVGVPILIIAGRRNRIVAASWRRPTLP